MYYWFIGVNFRLLFQKDLKIWNQEFFRSPRLTETKLTVTRITNCLSTKRLYLSLISLDELLFQIKRNKFTTSSDFSRFDTSSWNGTTSATLNGKLVSVNMYTGNTHGWQNLQFSEIAGYGLIRIDSEITTSYI